MTSRESQPRDSQARQATSVLYRTLGETMNALSRSACILAVGALFLTGCGGTEGSSKKTSPPPAANPEHVTAYRAGYTAGKAVYDASGKGAAVRETVWGGCTRRALDTGASAERDRGAWVQGCLDGVAAKPQNPPTGTVTERAEDSKLLESFRTWARSNGAQDEAQHANKLVTVQLTANDYDIELGTDYSAQAQQQSRTLAQHFVKWWDADHGKTGVARNVLILGPTGKRLLAKRI
jgi:hypothetical protein